MKHKARQVSEDDFTYYDHILCMDEENLRDLKEMAPKKYTATCKQKKKTSYENCKEERKNEGKKNQKSALSLALWMCVSSSQSVFMRLAYFFFNRSANGHTSYRWAWHEQKNESRSNACLGIEKKRRQRKRECINAQQLVFLLCLWAKEKKNACHHEAYIYDSSSSSPLFWAKENHEHDKADQLTEITLWLTL